MKKPPDQHPDHHRSSTELGTSSSAAAHVLSDDFHRFCQLVRGGKLDEVRALVEDRDMSWREVIQFPASDDVFRAVRALDAHRAADHVAPVRTLTRVVRQPLED